HWRRRQARRAQTAEQTPCAKIGSTEESVRPHFRRTFRSKLYLAKSFFSARVDVSANLLRIESAFRARKASAPQVWSRAGKAKRAFSCDSGNIVAAEG